MASQTPGGTTRSRLSFPLRHLLTAERAFDHAPAACRDHHTPVGTGRCFPAVAAMLPPSTDAGPSAGHTRTVPSCTEELRRGAHKTGGEVCRAKANPAGMERKHRLRRDFRLRTVRVAGVPSLCSDPGLLPIGQSPLARTAERVIEVGRKGPRPSPGRGPVGERLTYTRRRSAATVLSPAVPSSEAVAPSSKPAQARTGQGERVQAVVPRRLHRRGQATAG